MTKQSRRKFSAVFKAKVALEAIKNEKTMAELGHQFEINPVTISKWKNEFLERMSVIFENGTSKTSQESTPDLDQLYYQTKNGNDPAKSQESFDTKAMRYSFCSQEFFILSTC